MAKQLTQKTNKNLCSQPEIIFSGFKALCSKTDFSYISEKKWPHFSKMDILKMSNFGKCTNKFIPCFYVGYYYYWELYCGKMVHAK